MVVATSLSSNGQTWSAKSAINYGNKLVRQAKYELAIREYERVSVSDGDLYAQAIYNIGVCYYELWRTDEAIQAYKRALEVKKGEYPTASYALGIALEDQKRFGEAKDAFRQAMQKSGGELAVATYKLGLMLANENDEEAAAKLFREASKRRGAHVAASHNNLGVMLARMGRLAEAENEFVMAIRQSSHGPLNEAEHNLRLCWAMRASAIKPAIGTLNFRVVVQIVSIKES